MEIIWGVILLFLRNVEQEDFLNQNSQSAFPSHSQYSAILRNIASLPRSTRPAFGVNPRFSTPQKLADHPCRLQLLDCTVR